MNKKSLLALILITFTLLCVRLNYAKWETPTVTTNLTWDAFGYYLFLPAQFIYHDTKKMDWVPDIVNQYQTTGNLYQLSELPNGNRVMKYLLGVSIIYSPFFAAGHFIAGLLDYPQDGFSAPYQLAISFAALFYAFLGFWVLRRILLNYFSDTTTMITLLLVALATNYVQYVSVDSGMSHGYIFLLYILLLLVTIRWHTQPTILSAFFIGAIIGLGIISRPTEGVMLFIPLLFSTQNSIAKKQKWVMVRQHKSHIAAVLVGGTIGMLPQFLYWKIVTGNWIHDVGSKWTFFQPNWQVLFGWEKGWFIYTPVVILMVAGLFYFRKNPFYWSVLIYFLLNTWIVISWDDWRYGASYSSRALVQSYAVMSLPMAMVIQRMMQGRLKYFAFLLLGLIPINLFQIWQYNKTILHYNDMNRRYYQAVFLDPNPSPIEMSLMDTKEYIRNERSFSIHSAFDIDSQFVINVSQQAQVILFEKDLSTLTEIVPEKELWLKISMEEMSSWGAFDSFITTTLKQGDQTKNTHIRMHNGISKIGQWNKLEYYFLVPNPMKQSILTVIAETKTNQDILIRNMKLNVLIEK